MTAPQRTLDRCAFTLLALISIANSTCGWARGKPSSWDDQTTIPAAGDHRSALVTWPHDLAIGGSPGCEFGPPDTQASSADPLPALQIFAQPGLGLEGGPPTWLAATDPAGMRVVQADVGYGLRLIDLRRPAAPAVSPAAEIKTWIAALHAWEGHALLITRRERSDDLWWYELPTADSDGSLGAPKLLSHSVIEGAFRGSHRLPGPVPRVALIVDEVPARRCAARTGTSVKVVTLGSSDVAQHALGRGVLNVQATGSLLLVTRMEVGESEYAGAPPGKMSLLSLDALGSERELASRGPDYEAPTLHLDQDQLRVVWKAGATNTQRGQTPSQDTHVLHVNVAEPVKLELTRECVVTMHASGVVELDKFPPPPALQQTLFLPQRTLLAFNSNKPGTPALNVMSVDASSCERHEYPVAGDVLLAASEGRALVRLGPREEPTLQAQVISTKDFLAREAPIQLALTRTPKALANAPERAQTYFSPANAQISALSPERDLIQIMYWEFDEAVRTQSGTQLLTLEGEKLSAPTRLRSTLWLTADPAHAVAFDEQGLVLWDLRDSEARELGRVDVMQRYPQAVLLEKGFARLRCPSPSRTYDPASQAFMGQLEIVPGTDPQGPSARTTFEIPCRSKLLRAGQTLIAITQALSVENSHSRPCTMRVFDTQDPAHPTQVASLLDEALCDGQHALDDQPAHALDQALVFVRSEYTHKNPHELSALRFSLRVLDVSDPKHPRLRGPFVAPKGEFALSFEPSSHDAANRTFRYTYRVDAEVKDKERPETHYYMRDVRFDDLGKPSLGAPVSVPGEPWLVHESQLYTRDARWQKQGPAFLLRRSQLQPGKAEIATTRDMRGRELLGAVMLDHNRLLLAEAVAPKRQVEEPPSSQAIVLDATSLETIGESALGPIASPLMFAQGARVWLLTQQGGLIEVAVDEQGVATLEQTFDQIARHGRLGNRWLFGTAGVLRSVPATAE